jgi:hypothetical protein
MKPTFVNPAAMQLPRLYRGLLCLLIGMLLSACGGQGGPSAGVGVGAGTDTALAAQGQSNAAVDTATVLAGGYGLTQTNPGADFVSFVWVDRPGTKDPVTNWMALYLPPSKDPKYYPPVLFRGVLSLQSQGAASVAVTWFYPNNQLRGGTAAITGASGEGYQIAIPGINFGEATTDLQLSAHSLATSSDINKDWIGTWADAGPGGSIATVSTLRIQNGKANTDFGNCNVALNLAKDVSDKPFFLATVNLSSVANKVCERSPAANSSTTLDGIAFIHDAVAGSAPIKRLEVLLTDASGSGISFRGTQP